jgi:hypothetical protein
LQPVFCLFSKRIKRYSLCNFSLRRAYPIFSEKIYKDVCVRIDRYITHTLPRQLIIAFSGITLASEEGKCLAMKSIHDTRVGQVQGNNLYIFKIKLIYMEKYAENRENRKCLHKGQTLNVMIISRFATNVVYAHK